MKWVMLVLLAAVVLVLSAHEADDLPGRTASRGVDATPTTSLSTPTEVATIHTRIVQARSTLDQLEHRRRDDIGPVLSRFQRELERERARLVRARREVPPSIDTWQKLLERQFRYELTVQLTQRVAMLFVGAKQLLLTASRYDRAIRQLRQVAWQLEHLDALHRATDSPEELAALDATLAESAALVEASMDVTERHDLGDGAARVFDDAMHETPEGAVAKSLLAACGDNSAAVVVPSGGCGTAANALGSIDADSDEFAAGAPQASEDE